jgi:hypothetical protein
MVEQAGGPTAGARCEGAPIVPNRGRRSSGERHRTDRWNLERTGPTPVEYNRGTQQMTSRAFRMSRRTPRMPCRVVRMPCRVVRMPCRVVRMPCRVVRLPCRVVRLPCRVVRMPCRTTRMPCRVTRNREMGAETLFRVSDPPKLVVRRAPAEFSSHRIAPCISCGREPRGLLVKRC